MSNVLDKAEADSLVTARFADVIQNGYKLIETSVNELVDAGKMTHAHRNLIKGFAILLSTLTALAADGTKK